MRKKPGKPISIHPIPVSRRYPCRNGFEIEAIDADFRIAMGFVGRGECTDDVPVIIHGRCRSHTSDDADFFI